MVTEARWWDLDDLYKVDDNGLCIMDRDGGKIHRMLLKIGDWRGLFDALSHEYNHGKEVTEEMLWEKWRVILCLEKFLNFSFVDLAMMNYKECCNLLIKGKSTNPAYVRSRLQGIYTAIEQYAQFFKEASDLLIAFHDSAGKEKTMKMFGFEGWGEL